MTPPHCSNITTFFTHITAQVYKSRLLVFELFFQSSACEVYKNKYFFSYLIPDPCAHKSRVQKVQIKGSPNYSLPTYPTQSPNCLSCRNFSKPSPAFSTHKVRKPTKRMQMSFLKLFLKPNKVGWNVDKSLKEQI